MLNVLDAITTRRNIKEFRPDPVAQEQLESWLQAAAYAPNHRLTEPWEVLFIGQETRAKLNHKTNFGGAPVLLAILSAPGKTPLEHEENKVAVSCFVQNFSLAALEAGVGTRWSSLAAAEHIREILDVPAGYAVIGLLAVGYPAEVPEPRQRRPIEEKIKYLL